MPQTSRSLQQQLKVSVSKGRGPLAGKDPQRAFSRLEAPMKMRKKLKVVPKWGKNVEPPSKQTRSNCIPTPSYAWSTNEGNAGQGGMKIMGMRVWTRNRLMLVMM